MPKTKSRVACSVGHRVRVRAGVVDPDYPDLSIGGWAGTIVEAQSATHSTVLIRWSEETLQSQSRVYRNRCERDGFDGEEMWLDEGDLEPDDGSPVRVEPQVIIATKPLSMKNQDDRIRAVFGLTSDDPLPEADDQSLAVFYQHLAGMLSFPFAAEYSYETGPFRQTRVSLTVLSLVDPQEFDGDEYGLFCRAQRGREQIELPLAEIEGVKGPNQRLVSDYSDWFVNS